MSTVANKFRSLTKALSQTNLADDNDVYEDNSSSIFERSYKFISKISNHNNNINDNQLTQHPFKLSNKITKILLVIDNKENNWAKVFQGRSLDNDQIRIRLEQASFDDLKVQSDSEKGLNISIDIRRNGTTIARSFKPDFVLLREHVRHTNKDYKHILIGLMHGLVPSVNSLLSTYCFMDKPIVYSELLKIQRKLGRENFPLIDQKYYQSSVEMLVPPNLPIVIKVGSGNSGNGKVCVASPRGFQDVASLVAMTDNYATSETFLEGKYDIRIYKIGQRYRVFKRKSLSDAWKTNLGASAVEEIALTERYKTWADECSDLFGGLDVVCVEAIHTKDDKEYIIEVNNVANSICPDKKDEDMKYIANIVIKRMEEIFVDNTLLCPPTGHSIADAIQMISGPPSPANGLDMNSPLLTQNFSSESNELDKISANEINSRNTFANRASPSPSICSSSSITSSSIEHKRKTSLSQRFFSAFSD